MPPLAPYNGMAGAANKPLELWTKRETLSILGTYSEEKLKACVVVIDPSYNAEARKQANAFLNSSATKRLRERTADPTDHKTHDQSHDHSDGEQSIRSPKPPSKGEKAFFCGFCALHVRKRDKRRHMESHWVHYVCVFDGCTQTHKRFNCLVKDHYAKEHKGLRVPDKLSGAIVDQAWSAQACGICVQTFEAQAGDPADMFKAQEAYLKHCSDRHPATKHGDWHYKTAVEGLLQQSSIVNIWHGSLQQHGLSANAAFAGMSEEDARNWFDVFRFPLDYDKATANISRLLRGLGILGEVYQSADFSFAKSDMRFQAVNYAAGLPLLSNSFLQPPAQGQYIAGPSIGPPSFASSRDDSGIEQDMPITVNNDEAGPTFTLNPAPGSQDDGGLEQYSSSHGSFQDQSGFMGLFP